jgi:dUTP pyrophosphatase
MSDPAVGACAPVAFRATHRNLLPVYKTSRSTGADICSRVDIKLPPFKTIKVATGVFFDHAHPAMQNHHLTKDLYDVQVRLRSSWGLRGLVQPNAPATIDLDYQDEICVLLLNTKNYEIEITKGTPIAQIIINLAFRAANADVLKQQRNGGFGSTDTQGTRHD